jgi:hypothetical protein
VAPVGRLLGSLAPSIRRTSSPGLGQRTVETIACGGIRLRSPFTGLPGVRGNRLADARPTASAARGDCGSPGVVNGVNVRDVVPAVMLSPNDRSADAQRGAAQAVGGPLSGGVKSDRAVSGPLLPQSPARPGRALPQGSSSRGVQPQNSTAGWLAPNQLATGSWTSGSTQNYGPRCRYPTGFRRRSFRRSQALSDRVVHVVIPEPPAPPGEQIRVRDRIFRFL